MAFWRQTKKVSWRQTEARDIQGLVEVTHPSIGTAAIFEERARLFPEGSLVLVDTQKNIHGYAVSHPIRHAQIPGPTDLLKEIAVDADQYYIHDIAISPSLHDKKQRAAEVVDRLLKVAARFQSTCFVTVYKGGAWDRPMFRSELWGQFRFKVERVDEAFWGRFGLKPEKLKKIRKQSYGHGPVFLLGRSDDDWEEVEADVDDWELI